MRAGVIGPEFPPDCGGVETYNYEFSRELAGRPNVDVTVFTTRHPDGEADVAGGVVRAELQLCKGANRRTLFSKGGFHVWHVMNAACAWVALETNACVISSHGNDLLRPYYGLARRWLQNEPVIYRFEREVWRGLDWLWKRLSVRLMRKGLGKAHRIFLNSRYTEQAVIAKYPECLGKTSVAYVGMAENFFKTERQLISDGTTRLVTVCRLSEPRKNKERRAGLAGSGVAQESI